MQEPEQEARIAALAIQLGMNNEAEQLLKECGRYDLLNRFYQDSGRWTQALDTAKSKDRVHLRNTYHAHAQHLELSGKVNEQASWLFFYFIFSLPPISSSHSLFSFSRSLKTQQAVDGYEKAETHRFEVPRMMLDNPRALEDYINKSQDSDLLKWWAQYQESQQDMNRALTYYEAAGDIHSQARME